MDKLVITGGTPLKGTVQVSGAKNAALPILFASILTDQPCHFENVPNLADIATTLKLLNLMGVQSEYNAAKHSATVCAKQLTSFEAPYDLVRTMRASVLVLGPTLARFGEARVSLPGGCSIGARPVNLHLMALEKMGAQINLEGGYISATVPGAGPSRRLHGAEITFEQVSVGATENTLMAAVLANGKTILRNCAQEPEIVDLARCLRAMGAKISGEGTPVIEIEGVAKLHGVKSHRIIADRIEAGTFLIAGAITGGKVSLTNVEPELLQAVLDKLSETGARVIWQHGKSEITVDATGIELKAVHISTTPFPGFPTDMQAQFMALASVANGATVITENIFENRFMHVAELARLGAEISIQGRTAVIHGKPRSGAQTLTGATVMATDLRASACLVLGGLAARGETTVRRIYHLDRGYEKMEEKLRQLGARIERQGDH